MKRVTLFLFAGLFALAILPVPALSASKKGSRTIKKCQDATGRWHYGDNASAACASSKVMIINKEGVKTGVIDAPLTKAELKEREREKAQAEKAKEQAKRDELLLSTYPHENDILYIRDRKVAQLDSLIKASQDTLKPLRATLKRIEQQANAEQKSHNSVSEQTTKEIARTRSQIAKHKKAIEQRRQEQAAIKAQAAKDLKRYRELKGEPPKEKEAAVTKQ
jgi:hypothetical protein